MFESSVTPARHFIAHGNLSIDDFTDKVKELFENIHPEVTIMHEESTGNDPEAFPHLPVITYDIVGRCISKDIKSNKPRHFETYTDPEDPTQTIELYRMWYDTILEFQFFHDTNRGASLMMQDFEDFMFTYEGEFQRAGVADIIFDCEKRPEAVTRWGKSLTKRTLHYLVRTERITEIRSHKLREIETITTKVSHNGSPLHTGSRKSKAFIEAYNSMNSRKL